MKKILNSTILGLLVLGIGCTKDTTTTETKTPKVHAEFICNYDGETKSPLFVSFTNKSTNAKTYIWDFGDGNVSKTTSNSKISNIYYKPDIYFIELKAIGEPGDTSTCFKLVSIK